MGTTGEIHDYSKLIAELKARKVIVSVAADFMALVLLTAPGKRGRGYRFRFRPTLRRADGLRRPARGLLRGER
ncbi:hypothetical protein MJ390_24860 [Klebsiella pneumoniae]|nr:hypothetical protein MJ390_24860 [Klebsiella pneumoniae]